MPTDAEATHAVEFAQGLAYSTGIEYLEAIIVEALETQSLSLTRFVKDHVYPRYVSAVCLAGRSPKSWGMFAKHCERHFDKPSDMVNAAERTCGACHPLVGTMGWYEMEAAMWVVLCKMAATRNSWDSPCDLDFVDDVKVDDPDFGRCKFTEYFEERGNDWYMSDDTLAKLQSNIAMRQKVE